VTRLSDVLGISLPLLQAGMGGVAGPELAAEVSNSGAGGILALYKEAPKAIPDLVTSTSARTERPFGINIIPEVVGHRPASEQLHAALQHLPGSSFVTTFGLPDSGFADEVKNANRRLVIQVGTLDDASAALELGADVLVLQGSEAGGHHLGTTPSTDLLSDVRRRHPLEALTVAGGVATGDDLAAAINSGADGALAGTLFVPCDESRAHPAFKAKVLQASAEDTVVTDVFDIGWPHRSHRVLRNTTTEAPRAPAQFIATTVVAGRRLPVCRYSAAVPTTNTEGRIDLMAMYCGTSCARVTRRAPAADVVARLTAEFHAASAPVGS